MRRTFILVLLACIVLSIHALELGDDDKLIITVNIWGQVQKPGEYKVEYGSTIVQALSSAGGMTDYADMNNVKVIRYTEKGKQVFRLYLSKMLKGKEQNEPMKVENGDIIIVEKNIRKDWGSFVTFISQLAIIINVFYLISKS